MSELDIRGEVERLSEALVLVEPRDLPALAEIHTMFQSVEQWSKTSSTPLVAQATSAAANLVQDIILDDVRNPTAALDTLSAAAAALQEVVRDGRDPLEVDFPAELVGGEQKTAQSEAFAFAGLPAHIDERIFADFLARQPGNLDEIEGLIISLEGSFDEGQLQELRRAIHTLKGESGMLGLGDVERLCHMTEEVLSEQTVGELTDVLLGIRDWLGRTFDAYAGKGEPPGPVTEFLDRLSTASAAPNLVTPGPAAPPAPPVAPPEPPKATAAPPKPAPEAARSAKAKPALELAGQPKMLEGDPSLLGEFVTEAKEHLENADVHLLTLETDPKNEEALNAVFRAFHTIKGVSGFLALDDIQALSHEAENLLDRARKGELTLEGGYIDITFDSVDFLKRLVDDVADALSSGEPLAVEADLPAMVSRLRAALAGEIPPEEPVPEVESDQKLGEILVETGRVTENAVQTAMYQQRVEPEPEKLGEMLIDDNIITRTQLEQAFQVQKESGGVKKLGEVLLDMGVVTKDDLGALLDKQERGPEHRQMGKLLVESGEADAKDVAHALRGQQRQRVVEVKETVKVDAERLDRLIDLIGEMVIAESMVSQSKELSGNVSSEVSRQLNQLDKITRELQEMGTSLRMVPVRATFQKMARLARDVAKKANKQIDFVTVGEDTELDKSVVDKIGDPLVHMVRNSVDHGIEPTSEERVKAGKPPMGRVELRSFHKGGSIFVEVEDDGRGLDRAAIIKKAVERGLLKEGDNPSDSEVFKLIFEPGFSTAKEITDVSGRGVGMDVVRRNIEVLRGQIDIVSERGKGSTFTIRLPLTLAIIDGMVIRAGKERYIIPTLSVVRSIKPTTSDMFSVVKRGEMLSLQGQLIPMFRLHRMFRIAGAQEDPTKGIVVIVEDAGQQAAILVDELLGQQQIVIKSLGEVLQGLPGVAGGAIMADGLVGLILDVGGLVKLANTDSTPKEAARV